MQKPSKAERKRRVIVVGKADDMRKLVESGQAFAEKEATKHLPATGKLNRPGKCGFPQCYGDQLRAGLCRKHTEMADFLWYLLSPSEAKASGLIIPNQPKHKVVTKLQEYIETIRKGGR